jgi:hypothetical protein
MDLRERSNLKYPDLKIEAYNIFTYQSLDQLLVQYIIPVVQSFTNRINEIQEPSTE